MEFLQKPKNRTPILSSNSAPGCIPRKKNENTNSEKVYAPRVYSSSIFNSQDIEATHEPNRRLNRMCVTQS